MPSYLVTFDRPVRYNAGHPQGERVVTELPVRAASEEGARAHAYRTTQGEALLSVREVPDFVSATPPVEPPPDPEPTMLLGDPVL